MNPAGKVLISGASGPIGTAIIPCLRQAGYHVFRLVRRTSSSPDEILWDTSRSLASETVSEFDAVIHLAGETIAQRWTAQARQQILTSRKKGTLHLAQALAKAPRPPRVFVSASAVGYYGSRGDEVLREDSPSGTGFPAEVCREWEAATEPTISAGVRTAIIRIGLALSGQGGALPKMLLPFRLGLGGKMGSGRQWWPWIHVQDIAGAVLHILNNELLRGPINLVAPNPVTNAEFTKTLAAVLRRPAVFPMPNFAVGLAFGEMGEQLMLSSQRVEAAKLQAAGYQFRFADLRRALADILRLRQS